MDFEYHYTQEQEEFRKEVRAFIEENALKEPLSFDAGMMHSAEAYWKGREIAQKLGAKGWYAPNYPKKYGGGGLELGKCVILAEEFARISQQGRWIGMSQVSGILTGGIMAHGTEEQKQRFLVPLLKGEIIGWQCFTEPDAGSDEAAMKSTAVRDGDVFVINGDKVFVGESPIGCMPDFLYWPAVTDPKAPRHENISAFFIPSDMPGIHYQPLNLFTSVTGQKWEVICEDVRCPADRLIGELNKGWLVTQATLVLEHGGGGSLVPRNKFILDLINYCKKTMRNGQPISSDPMVQDILVQLYMEYQVSRLWGLRNFAMSEHQIPRVPYTGTQTLLHEKLFDPQLGKALLDILGPHGLVIDPELQLLRGQVEYHIRHGDCTHPGGTPEIQKIWMSRALGLGRSTEKR
jgi:3-oxocholest-4-en-26-oyl-CoA dehydrogenase alpha subunit